MPGKRSRQLLRTVSLSQLVENGNDRNPALRDTKMMMQLASAASAPESSPGDGSLESIGPSFHGDVSLESIAACSYRDADFSSMYENTEEICFGEFEAPSKLGNILLQESNPYMNSEPLNNNIENEGLIFASVSTPAASPSLGKPLQQEASHQENHHVPWQYQMSSILLEAAHGSALPTPHFLDACYLCSKRIGHGEDVFIYRGDRAFCSDECRHVQIVADERREKCGLAF